MPSVTHDGRSFMVDGKRVWLVSGRVPYARLPRNLWAARILAAKNAGLNTIETPVFWNRHETRPGRFEFTGENDLRHFIDLVGKAGMYCILGLGPYVGSDWDMGGLPAYLRENTDTKFRTNNPAYLEACSRFIGAVADQVRGWQITAPGTGGPIILLQCESEWTCGHQQLATQYLGELTRYIRESGLSVPIANSNNLWQSVEGQIDGWSGTEQMLGVMRQLAKVRDGQPRVVLDFATSRQDTWGDEPRPVMTPREVERRLTQIAAGGGQWNITSFCGGTNFGFFGGRTDDGLATFATHAADHGCALDQAGQPTPIYAAIKRVSLMASRFGRVLSALDPSYQPVTIAGSTLGSSKKSKATPTEAGVSVVHTSGPQGGMAFVFAHGDEANVREATLLLHDGTELPVALGTQPAAWCLLDVNVSPRCRVDYCNVSALGTTSNILVAFGPAGGRAIVSVNGAPVESTIPDDEQPEVLTHEGLVIVLVRAEEAASVGFGDDAVYVGVAGMSTTGQPMAMGSAKQCLRIGADAKAKPHLFEQVKRAPRSEKVAIEHWTCALQNEYTEGTSPRYAGIPSVQGLAALGAPSGYGWYRFALENDQPADATIDFGVGGDRFHIFSDGRHVATAGVGPGALPQVSVHMKKGTQTLVVLAENLGRFASGLNVGEPKGLVDDVFDVVTLKLSKPAIEEAVPVALLPFRAPLWDVAEGDVTDSYRAKMTFKLAAKATVLLRMSKPPSAGLLLLNNKPFAAVDRSGPGCIEIPSELVHKGVNTLELTVLVPDQVEEELEASAKSIELFEVVGGLAERSEVGFARWEQPQDGAFVPVAKAHPVAGQPAWFRGEFAVRHAEALYFEPVGLTKGQFFVNGKHVGRYFVATKAGKPVPPQSRYYIPGALLKAGPDERNELVIFDEHGHTPGRVRLTS
jgi:beta-galactosidase